MYLSIKFSFQHNFFFQLKMMMSQCSSKHYYDEKACASYRFVPMASISSMKTIEGACSSATLNNSRTSFGPSPRYF